MEHGKIAYNIQKHISYKICLFYDVIEKIMY